MDSYRKNARIAGILFIAAIAVPILSMPFTRHVNTPDYLINLAANANQVTIGALIELIYAFACASIAIWLYPVLKKYNESLALGSVGFRFFEGLLYIVSVTGLLSLLALSQEFVKVGAPDASSFQVLGTLLLAARGVVGQLGSIAFIAGAFMYYYVFYKSKLIPRWLSVWGLIGVPLWIAGALLHLFGLVEPFSTTLILLDLPIATNELVLALWLIFKGFNRSAIASLSAK
ncbi:DUF4386 domain-containing protein [Chloroflexota bacterium]